MTSQILQEGLLDVKVPRGSEDRKLWKAWRRQWASFSVVHPPGRREPYLLLELAHNSSATPGNRIRISRDGLRLFRCRSRSRPYRTWAMISGKKLILFFAADNETQAQEWMQTIRDGLWPPCFSFQMLTACTHEVSLIDDDNTFLSGLLGVYGRLVLTSEDVVSLMHPHWGATQLEVSLTNLEDIHVVRNAEDSSAGVLSIALKGPEDSKLRNLQFYCYTVKDAMQWIWSKMIMKKLLENGELPDMKQQIKSNPNGVVSSEISQLNYKDDLSNYSPVKSSTDIDKTSTNVPIDLVDTTTDYENLKCLELNYIQNGDSLFETFTCDPLNSVNNQDLSKNISNHILTNHVLTKESSSDISICHRRQFSGSGTINFDSSEDALYENVKYDNFFKPVETTPVYDYTNSFFNSDNSTVYANANVSYENSPRRANDSGINCLNVTLKSPEYAVVNKVLTKGSPERILNTAVPNDDFINNLFDQNQNDSLKYQKIHYNIDNISSSPNFESEKLNILASNSNHDTVFTPQNTLDDINAKFSNSNFSQFKLDPSLPVHEFRTLKSAIYGIVNKQSVKMKVSEQHNSQSSMEESSKIKPDSSPSLDANDSLKSATYGVANKESVKTKILEQTQNSQVLLQEPSTNKSIDTNHEMNKFRLLPNIPSDFLDTSINFAGQRNKTNSDSFSSDDDFETSPQRLVDDYDDKEFTSHIYEYLSDRKGTVYEEIDDSDDEYVPQLPPQLPKRPPNLKIPTSLRLQKLSESITETLKVMETTPSPTEGYLRPNFIKKIRDMSKIMHVTPNQEADDESNFRKTYPLDSKVMQILVPAIKQNAKIERKTITKPGNINSLQIGVQHPSEFS